jgi:pimeloyl-ACP methyl ester carboxylesterase
MNAELPQTSARHDLRLHLAAAGVSTWGLDYRTHAVPAEGDDAARTAVASWNADVFAADAAWAIGFVRAIDRGPIFLAGFSYGAGLAYRLAARREAGIAGLVILDGAAGGGGSGGSGVLDVGSSRLPWDARKRLLTTVIAGPQNPSPIAGHTTAGGALADILWTSQTFGGNGGLSAARDGVSDIRVVARLLETYDRWWPAAASDGRAWSPSRPLPVFAFAATRMGTEWVTRVRESARAFGGERAQVRELQGFGHLDVLVGRQAPWAVYEPVLQWVVANSSAR